MNKILIVVYGGGHVNIIIKLYKELSKRFDLSIFALNTAKQALINENIPFKDLNYYNEQLDDSDDISKIGKKFIEDNSIDYSKLGYEDSILYYGYNVRDYMLDYGKNDLNTLYKKHGRVIFSPMHTMSKIMEYENPDAVLTTNSPRFERAALLVSKKKNIINFSIEDLLGQPRLRSVKEKEIYKNYYGDYIFVMNNIAKEILIRNQIQANDIIVSGQPVFESINKEQYDKIELMKILNIQTNKKIILWPSQITKDREYIGKKLVEVFEGFSDKLLIIKPHPSENVELIKKELADKNYKNTILENKTDIRKLISMADVILTQNSTTGLEAVLMNKPLVVLNPGLISYDPDYHKLGLGLLVTEFGELEKVIEKLLDVSDTDRGILLQNIELFKMPLNCKKTICDFIYGKLNSFRRKI